jgi:hypothetical protein
MRSRASGLTPIDCGNLSVIVLGGATRFVLQSFHYTRCAYYLLPSLKRRDQLIDQFERLLLHHEIVLRAVPSNFNDVFLEDFLPFFLAEIQNNKCKWNQENGRKTYSISSYEEVDGFLVLLFNMADTLSSDPSVQNCDTLAVRTMNKQPIEGVSYSALGVIDTRIVRLDGPKYRFFLEDAPGLSKSYLAPFLTAAVRNCQMQQANAAGGMRNVRAKFEIDAFTSATLREDLAAGRITHIELVQRMNQGGDFDNVPHLESQTYVVKINLDQQATGNLALNIINQIKNIASLRNYESIKIKYRGDENREKTSTINPAVQDAGDTVVTKNDVVRVQNSREQCETVINQQALHRILAIARLER